MSRSLIGLLQRSILTESIALRQTSISSGRKAGLDPPTWGAPAARVRERPDSLCQAALETRNEGETLSLRQLGYALAPRTHVDFT